MASAQCIEYGLKSMVVNRSCAPCAAALISSGLVWLTALLFSELKTGTPGRALSEGHQGEGLRMGEFVRRIMGPVPPELGLLTDLELNELLCAVGCAVCGPAQRLVQVHSRKWECKACGFTVELHLPKYS